MNTSRTRKAVHGLLAILPESCTLEELQYRLYVLQAVERGRREILARRGIAHDEVARRLRKKWRAKSAR